MPWDIGLHFALRATTATLAIAALVYGAMRAVVVRGDGWRRALRAIGAPLLLGIAILSIVDIVAVLRLGVVPESRTIDWFWASLDELMPIFFLLQIESWRRRDQLEAQLAALSETDPLTGLPNRRGFLIRAQAAMATARRGGGRCSVVMLDLDRFKAINDGFGHPAGDAVLRGVAVAITEAVRGTDVVGRLGGEEFALLLPDDLAGAAQLAERLRVAVAASVAHPAGAGHRVTFSAGVAALDPTGSEAVLEAALAAADRALYAAKASGRDRVLIG
ncbi:GGDEF domain-containing protein [Roseomonas sp. CAU 1739]|uniref:GGDEF domain-containing protein n=1 Tax=Roseomonas sp. CAU 1739 TaxID=3140364 RepID=UPI00325BD436